MTPQLRNPHGKVNHERWLVSYADFITLLFAFFVVMYAFAKADQKKQQQVAAAISAAFHVTPIVASRAPESGAAQPPNPVMQSEIVSPGKVRDDLEKMRHELEQSLTKEIAAREVSVEMTRDGLVISLREAGFFDSGSATPRPESIPTLRNIAEKLNTSPYDMRIEGHTDNIPMHSAQFDSNWELSSSRATHIARIFLDLKAMPPERMSAAGFAEFHPIASNDTAEGRAKNRRVDLVILPRSNVNLAGPEFTRPAGTWHKITDEDQSEQKP
jgi:chemotaxis protein MotB